MRANNHSSAGPPPPPIKRKNRQALAASPAAGTGFNFANNSRLKKPSIEGPSAQLYDIVPDTTIGFGVEVNGDMEFSHLLRVDGKFKGRLSVTQNGDNSPSTFTDNMGDLIIGEHGILIGDVGDSCNIRCMIMEGGEVIGNVSVEELVLLNNAKISGKITAKFCTIGENAIILTGGESVNIHPLAPEVLDDIMLEYAETNHSLISKQELDSSPYASRPNQRRQVMLEKKRRREMFPDPSQPLFEVPSVQPVPAIPAKLIALWKNDKAYGNGGDDREKIRPVAERGSSISDASIISKPSDNQHELFEEEKRPPDSDKAVLSPVHVSRVEAPEEVAQDDGDGDGEYEDDGGGDEASTVNILPTAVLAAEDSVDDSATGIAESELAIREDNATEKGDANPNPAKREDDATEKGDANPNPNPAKREDDTTEKGDANPNPAKREDDVTENGDAQAEEAYENDEDNDKLEGEGPAVEGDSSRLLTSAGKQEPDATNQHAIVDDQEDSRTEAEGLEHPNATIADAVDATKPQDTADADDGNYEEDAEGEANEDSEAKERKEEKVDKGGEEVHYNVRLSKIALKLEAKPDAAHIFQVEGSFPASASSWSASTPSLDPGDLPSGMQELLEWDCGNLPGMEFVAAASDATTQLFKLSISKNLLSAEVEQWTVLAEGSAKLSERVSISTMTDGVSEEASAASQVHELRFPFYLRENEEQLFATATVLFNMSAMYIAKL